MSAGRPRPEEQAFAEVARLLVTTPMNAGRIRPSLDSADRAGPARQRGEVGLLEVTASDGDDATPAARRGRAPDCRRAILDSRGGRRIGALGLDEGEPRANEERCGLALDELDTPDAEQLVSAASGGVNGQQRPLIPRSGRTTLGFVELGADDD